MHGLEGKVAVVTGASRGIGAGIARKLAAQGAKVVLNYTRNEEGARKVAEEAIQLHGGIGMTWEYNLAHHAKRLVMIAHQFGDDDHHLKAYAKLMQVA